MSLIIVVMDVAQSGKSVVGGALDRCLGFSVFERDDLHPAADVAKMSAGHPLDDADCAAWFDRVAAWITTYL